MSVSMLNANFIEPSNPLTPFSNSTSFVEASSPIKPPTKVEDVASASQTCSNCRRRFVYKLNYAKHVTMCGREQPAATNSNNGGSSNNNMKTSNIVQYCNQCQLQLIDAASVERHRLAHGLITKLSHSLQLTLTSSLPSPALEWFVGKIQFDFNDNAWGQSAVHQVDRMLTNCCLDDLLYLAKDCEFQPMVDVLLADHHKQTTQRRHANGSMGSPKRQQLIGTGLVKPLVLQILSKEIKRMEPAKVQRKQPPSLVPALPPPSPTSAQMHKETPGTPLDSRPLPSSIAGQVNPPAEDQQQQRADQSQSDGLAHFSSSSKYMCSECGACYSSAAVVFTHMCCQHPLSGNSVTDHSSVQSFRHSTLPFPPLIADDLLQQQQQESTRQQRKQPRKQKPADRSPAKPLPPCSLLLQRKKLRRSADCTSSRLPRMVADGQDFFLEQLTGQLS